MEKRGSLRNILRYWSYKPLFGWSPLGKSERHFVLEILNLRLFMFMPVSTSPSPPMFRAIPCTFISVRESHQKILDKRHTLDFYRDPFFSLLDVVYRQI